MDSMKKLALLSAAITCSAAQMAQAAVALDPQAFNWEPFRFIPTLEVQAREDSNIYKMSSNEVSSFVTVVKPTFDLVAQDRDNVYSARYAMAAGFYGEDINNYTDNMFNLNAHVEPTGRFRFDLGAGYNFLHDDIGTGATDGRITSDALAQLLGSPDTYTLGTLSGGMEYGAKDAAGQVALNLNFGQTRYDRQNVIGGVLPSAAVDKDMDSLNGLLEFRLRVMPKTKLLLDYEYSKGDYDNATTASVADYTGNAYFLGVTWESTASTTGKIRLGSNNRDRAGKSLSGFAWDVGVVWTPLERTRFTLDGSRRLQDATLPYASVDGRNIAVGWGHDWSERIESKLTLGVGKDDYDPAVPGSPARNDDSRTVGAVVNYQMRRWLVLGAGVSNTNRDSSLSAYEYDRTVFSLNAQLSL